MPTRLRLASKVASKSTLLIRQTKNRNGDHICQHSVLLTLMKIVGRERRDGVSSEVVGQAVEETQRYLRDTEEAAWRAAFKPHAVIVTDRARPEPLFVAFFIGVNRLVRVDFDPTQRPVTFLRQALDGVREKLSEFWAASLRYFSDGPVGVLLLKNFFTFSPKARIAFRRTLGYPGRAFCLSVWPL